MSSPKIGAADNTVMDAINADFVFMSGETLLIQSLIIKKKVKEFQNKFSDQETAQFFQTKTKAAPERSGPLEIVGNESLIDDVAKIQVRPIRKEEQNPAQELG